MTLRDDDAPEFPADPWAPPRIKRRRFTDKYLSALKARPQRYDVLDPARKGLLLRVTANGTKTFFLRNQRNLKPVRS